MQNLSTIYPSGSGSFLVYANAVSSDGLKKKSRWEAYTTN
jgi:hypothetical protein